MDCWYNCLCQYNSYYNYSTIKVNVGQSLHLPTSCVGAQYILHPKPAQKARTIMKQEVPVEFFTRAELEEALIPLTPKPPKYIVLAQNDKGEYVFTDMGKMILTYGNVKKIVESNADSNFYHNRKEFNLHTWRLVRPVITD